MDLLALQKIKDNVEEIKHYGLLESNQLQHGITDIAAALGITRLQLQSLMRTLAIMPDELLLCTQSGKPVVYFLEGESLPSGIAIENTELANQTKDCTVKWINKGDVTVIDISTFDVIDVWNKSNIGTVIQNAKLWDSSRSLKSIGIRISDATLDGYSLKRMSNDHYEVLEDGEHKYDLYQRGGHWACTCTGYKYRHTCKHLELLKQQGTQTQQLHGVYARRAQIKKSLDIWEQRFKDNPSKTNQKQYELRKKQYEDIQKRCEEEDKAPKPQRHPRSEFLGVVPLIDKLCGNLPHEIVGSWRRGKSTYKDCDVLILATPSEWEKFGERVKNDPNFGPAPGHMHIDFGKDLIRGGYKNGDRVDYLDCSRVQDPNRWGAYLLYRTGCFTGETKVQTVEGLKRIDELVIGDKVFTGEGKITEVTAIMVKYFDHLVKFKSRGAEIRCTEDHNILVTGNGTQGVQYEEPKWQEASTLGRYCSLYYPYLQLPETEKIDNSFAFLLGFYLADGNLHARDDCPSNKKHKISDAYRVEICDGVCSFDMRFSIPFNKYDEFKRIFEDYKIPIYSVSGGRGNEGTIIIKEKVYSEFCLRYGGVTFKKKNLHKIFNKDILLWNKEAKQHLLKGFFLGDGTFSKSKHADPTFLNTNEEIINGLYLIARSMYAVTGYRKLYDEDVNKKALYGFNIVGEDAYRIYNELLKDCEKAKGVKCLSWSKDPVYQAKFNDSKGFQKILRGKPTIETYADKVAVFDITVADKSHTFLIEDGFCVHNSSNFNIAMRSWLKRYGCGLSERGLIGPDKQVVASKTEKDIFDAIGIPYIKPEDREDAVVWKHLINQYCPNGPKFLQDEG